MTVMNLDNSEWKTGANSLFLGESMALFDSINIHHPRLMELYRLQKSMDWSDQEVDLSQDRLNLISCPTMTSEIMIKNLVFQWGLDSVASRAIAPLFAPMVSDSSLWAAWMKISEIEVLHALTYSEIARQCIPEKYKAFAEFMENTDSQARASTIVTVFNELQYVSGKLACGDLDRKKDEELIYDRTMNGVVALLALESLQFMSSFAATFALVETGLFQGIGRLVQKIMNDERGVHVEVDKYIIQHELKTERGQRWYKDNKVVIEAILMEVYRSELEWNTYLFSEGRAVVGLNKALLDLWTQWCAQLAFDILKIELPFERQTQSPLKYMDNWLDQNKFQVANQEADNTNYCLNVMTDDTKGEEFDVDF